jgi:hypothetical protein
MGPAVQEDGLVCAAFMAPVEEGRHVVLIDPSPPQSWLEATVEIPAADECSFLAGHALPRPFSRLGMPSPAPAERIRVAVVTGLSPTVRDRRVVLEPHEGQILQFRTCTSSEGLHLTAWDGEPLKGERTWHSYVYLGYDVEASCTDADSQP